MMRVPINEVTCVRDFIRGSFLTLRETIPTLTLEGFADRLGIGRSSLKMIVSGKRRPTSHQMLSIGRGLRLSAQEIHLLQLLGLSDSAENAWEKLYYAGLLKKSRSALKIKSTITAEAILLKNPLSHPVLVLLMGLDKPLNEETLKWVAKKLALKISIVQNTVDDLKRLAS